MVNMPTAIPVLILAAGASTRMKGEIKQLLPWGKTTLLENAVYQAKGVSDSVHVVLGANAMKILESISLDVNIIQNKDWESGMGSSISTGMQHVLTKANPKAILIMLCDQPFIDAPYLSELTKKFTGGTYKIVATAHQNGVGVPAIFDNSLFSELQDLSTDFGARKIIQKHGKFAYSINPNGKEVDVDTKEKYIQLTEIQNNKYE